jgi:hypothetical protein
MGINVVQLLLSGSAMGVPHVTDVRRTRRKDFTTNGLWAFMCPAVTDLEEGQIQQKHVRRGDFGIGGCTK